MPRNKDLKRLTRSRTAKAGISDDTVCAKTGRDWKQWVQHLDAAGAASMPHREIAKYLHDQFGISGWWAQMVTVGYERIRGLREIGQRRSGTYEANKSKTLPVPITKLYRAFSIARTRNRWLPGGNLTVRKAVAGKSIRFTWEDGAPVEVYFIAKAENKSHVAIQHRMLGTKSDASKMKEYWGDRLSALAEILVPPEAARR